MGTYILKKEELSSGFLPKKLGFIASAASSDKKTQNGKDKTEKLLNARQKINDPRQI
ncbi:MAG: hypothetical protein LBI40_01765 [Treponema sp.]|nr:hypothetical protein [Treponema sp.]